MLAPFRPPPGVPSLLPSPVMSEREHAPGVDWGVVKGAATGVLLAVGGLAAISLVLSVLEPLLIIGILGGVGWLGYRLLGSGTPALEGERRAKSLPPAEPRGATDASDFERRMAELEAIERKLDAEIGSYE